MLPVRLGLGFELHAERLEQTTLCSRARLPMRRRDCAGCVELGREERLHGLVGHAAAAQTAQSAAAAVAAHCPGGRVLGEDGCRMHDELALERRRSRRKAVGLHGERARDLGEQRAAERRGR